MRKCKGCSIDMPPQPGRGKWLRYCSANCKEAALMGKRLMGRAQCCVPDCKNPVRPGGGKTCEMHYMRMRRRGTYAAVVRNGRFVTKEGYAVVTCPSHPLASNGGNTYEHRLVAYAKHNGQCPPCYWCEKPLSWQMAVIDHLNEVKHDNRPDNLVVACNSCNRARGAFSYVVRKMTKGSFAELAKAMIGLVKDADAPT